MRHAYMIALVIFILGFTLLTVGCSGIEIQNQESVKEQVKVTTPARIALSWENTTEPHPERKPWSDLITAHLQKNINIYNQATDIAEFCPKFKTLNDPPKVKALGELIVAMIYYESGYKPTSWMAEKFIEGYKITKDPKTGAEIKTPIYRKDSVTGVQVKSEGLFQLSYSDIPNYGSLLKGCGIDWSKDKLLDQNDPKKTMFNPLFNLECGMRILTNQVKNKKAIGLEKGVYWAVIRKGGKFTRIPQIAARVQKNAPGCK